MSEGSNGAMKFCLNFVKVEIVEIVKFCKIVNFVKVEILWNLLFGNEHCMFVSDEEEGRSSHLLFTLHVYQYRIEKANQAGLPGGESSSFRFLFFSATFWYIVSE